MMETDEDRNVIGVLRGHLGFLESDGSVLEVLGVAWSLGVWGFGQCSVGVLEDGWNGVGGAVGD